MLSDPRRLTAIGVFAGVAALAITGGLGVVGAMTLRDSKGRAGAVDTGPVKDQFPDTPALLMIQTGDDTDKSLTGVTVMVKTPKSGGWLIDLPVDIQVAMPGTGSDGRLRDVYKANGKTGLLEAVEGLMRVTIDDGSLAVMTHADLRGVLAPYAPTEVRLKKSVADLLTADKPFLPSGTSMVEATSLSRLLTYRPIGWTAAEVQDLRVELFRAILGGKDLGASASAATARPTTTTETTTPGTAVPNPDAQLVSDFLRWIRDGKNVYPNLCDPKAACTQSKDGSIKFDDTQLRLYVAQAMPGRVNDLGTGPTLRVINHLGPGYLLHATQAATSPGFANGVLVSATEAEGPAPAVTEYLYADDSDRATAEFMIQFLGPGEVKKIDRGIDGIDVVVNLGQNFADRINQEEAQATTTTTTTPTSQSSTSVKKSSSSTTRKRTTVTTRKKNN